MPNIFNILVSLEAESIASSGSYHPVESGAPIIDSKYVHILTYDGTTVIDNGGKLLSLKNVHQNNSIIWTEASLTSFASKYSVLLTSVVPDDVTSASNFLSKADLRVDKQIKPIITEANPLVVVLKEVDQHFWVSSIQRSPISSVQIPFTCVFEIYEGPNRIGFGKYKHILELSL
ncbi:AidA/PixA family protein [Xenorhabdus littoralis]|uniref:AidA/PixA family protein n=1 Tax=Xenorhabdus littoralis TaxID=2582835 RepID=UPI0029E7EA0C|nr:AidA/PixA family protein [Xenorhabdus sp. psl]MDX7992541.1 hypothetical protein [Xenorhabdus sp. psl]